MTNEELSVVMKNFAAKANDRGNLSFMDALDLISRAQFEEKRVEDCVNWFCETRKELVESKSGKTRNVKKFPHAKIVADKLYNTQIVKAYADAYIVALAAKEGDSSEDYAEVHNAVADSLAGYFDALYIDYMSERYGDDFIEAYADFENAKAKDEKATDARKEYRSAKQSLSRLKKGNDADKIAEAEKRLADAKAKALELGVIDESEDEE
mgnify:CR=1 FL=1